MLGKSYPALLRQYETGGPVYTVTPAQSPNSGNFDGQTPLRRAATALGQQVAGLGMTRPDCMTYARLAESVGMPTTAQGNIDDPAPTAHQVMSKVAELERHLADAPKFTRPLRVRIQKD